MVLSPLPLHVKAIRGYFEDKTSMEELDPQEEDRLLYADLDKESHGYSLNIELQMVKEFEDHIGFPRLLSGSQLIRTQ